VVVLDRTGRNFAAGMSGGIAYVHDGDGTFSSRCNQEMVDLEPVAEEEDVTTLHHLVESHFQATGSTRAQELLQNWDQAVPKFVKIFPRAYRRVLEERRKRAEAEAEAELVPHG
jgi:glutamate synthase (NADPH/NADH)